MEIGKHQSYECPSLEDLSAWLDKELESETMNQHVLDCPMCQKCLEDFRSINDSILDFFTLDEDRLCGITQNCIHEVSKIKLPKAVKPFPGWTKIAAGIVVVGIVFFMSQSKEVMNSNRNTIAVTDNDYLNDNSDRTYDNYSSDQRYEEPIRPTHTVSHQSSNLRSNQRNVGSKPSVSVSPLSSQENFRAAPMSQVEEESQAVGPTYIRDDIRLIGFGVNDSYQSIEDATYVGLDKAEVDGFVRHKWEMDDPISPLIFLKTLLVRQQDAFDQLIRKDQDRYHLKFRIKDTSLTDLVDNLDRLDCNLLNSDLPQPGKSGDFSASGTLLQYEVDFVKR